MKDRTRRLVASIILVLTFLGTDFLMPLLIQMPKVFASADWLNGWSYRRKLTVNSVLIDADLTNFPVLVNLDSSFFNFSKARDNGEDIRFTSSDGVTPLKYEIERWNKTAGKAEIWVKVPSVSEASDTDFFIYYGNPSASSAQDPTNVWDGNFKMVQHLKEKSGTHEDSTTNNNDGSPQGGVTQGTTGKIDGADGFDGVNDCVNCGTQTSLTVTSMTIEAWVKRRGNGDTANTGTGGFIGEPIVAKGRAHNETIGWNVNYFLAIRQSDVRVGFDFEDNINGGNHPIFSTSSLVNNQWYHLVITHDLSTLKMYINGVQNNSLSMAYTPDYNRWAAAIGSSIAGSPLPGTTDGFFNGTIDEVRISNNVRSTAWVKATYHSGNDSLLTYGSEEQFPAPTFSNITYNATHVGAPCEFKVKWSDPDGLDACIFTTNNTGIWQNQTIPVSGTVSWANITKTLNSTVGLVVGFRWYCNDTLGNMGDTGIQTLTTSGDWQYAMKLWFNNTAVTEKLVNFPVMINLSRGGTDFWDHVGQTSKDLRFVDADCITDLYFEVEYWNYTGKKAYVWVKVPKIDAGSTADFIYVYYGNPSPPESPYNNPAQVWDNNFRMVHHLEETSGMQYDSTSNHNDGTPYGSLNKNAIGKIDGADGFDGVNDYINCGNHSSLTITEMTIEAWVKRLGNGDTTDTGTGGFTGEPIVTKGRAYVETLGLNVNYFVGIRQTDKVIGFDFEDNTDGTNHPTYSSTVVQNGQWYYIAVTYDGTSKIYVNGALDNSLAISKTPDYNPWATAIGSSIAGAGAGTTDGFFNGTIDEVRISNRARSAEWVEAQYLSMNDQYVTFGSEQAPNNPPNKPANPNPPDGATGVPTSTTLSVDVTDPDGDTMDVYFYEPGTEGPTPQNFTIIALPDTQYYSQTYPSIFDNQTQWVVNNAGSMNIVFVTHVGDIVEIWSNLTQWNNANNSMSKLDHNVQWGILPGNHDGANVNVTNYNHYFGYDRFSGETWYGGAYQNNNTNSYQLFSAGADDYLIFHFQNAPSNSVLAWANTTIGNYPHRRVIVTTHDYLATDASRSATGENIWQKFIKPHADQVFLVLCGHATAEARRTDTVSGHIVYQLLANYQSRANGGNGWLRIVKFCPVEDKIYVKTYSPYLNSYEIDSNSEFTLDYNMTGSSSTGPALIGIDTNVPSGGVASVPWAGLNYTTTYSWYAVANDTEGALRQSDTWNFTTRSQAEPPVANFTYSPTSPLTGETVTFNATLSTDEGTIVSYEWDFGDGTNGTGMITTHAYDDNGTYTVTLTVTDDDGLNDTDSQNITVLNRPPIASFTESATSVPTGTVIAFNASSSYDPDGYISSYFWDFGDGTNGTGVTTEHAYADNGTYTVALTVTDDDGATAITTAEKTVSNRLPIASFTENATTVYTGEFIDFNASGSYDPDGVIISYFWDFGDGNNVTGAVVNHAYSDDGNYTVTLTVTDDDGATAFANATKTVLNRPPVASFTESAETVYTDEIITFNASHSYDLDGTIVSYYWEFGDGTNTTGLIVNHSYAVNGTYTVILTVTDDDGMIVAINAIKTVLNRPDIAVTNVTSSKTIVGQGYGLYINVTVANQGDYTETFNVTVYANTTIIETKTNITLTSGNSTTLTFTWNTTGFAKGNYTISAYAWPVLGETYGEDNTYIDGWVKVTIVGDINGDQRVDGKDIALCIKAYGSYLGHPKWNPNADINCDDKVDAKDIALTIKNYGKAW